MKQVTTRYFCDVCHKEITGWRDIEKEINTLRIPVQDEDGFVHKADIEVCDDCLQKLAVLSRTIINNHAEFKLIKEK